MFKCYNICIIYFSLGHKPWYPYDGHYNPIWFTPMFAPRNYRGHWKWCAADEWRKMLDAWVYFIFRIPGFTILKHTARNLGKELFIFVDSMII